MRKMRMIGLILVTALVSAIVVSCKDDDEADSKNPIVGSWTSRLVYSDSENVNRSYTFKKNGNFQFVEKEGRYVEEGYGTYVCESNVLTLTYSAWKDEYDEDFKEDDGFEVYDYQIVGDTLKLDLLRTEQERFDGEVFWEIYVRSK